MKLLGITGGVGMGKSTAEQFLEQRGVRVLDTDVIARQLVEPGEPALEEIRRTFGPEFLDAEGRLCRERMAALVFQDAAARRKLEALLHPRIRERWLAETEAWRRAGVGLGAVVIPLLFETQAARHFDLTVCVACSAATQRERLAQRGWSAEEVQARVAAQMPIEAKMAAADRVVWTEGTLAVHGSQWDRILALLPGAVSFAAS